MGAASEESEVALAEGSIRGSLKEGDRGDLGADSRRRGREAAERERCCSAMRRRVMRFRMARFKKLVMTLAGRYLRDS